MGITVRERQLRVLAKIDEAKDKMNKAEKHTALPWRVSKCVRTTQQGTTDLFIEHGDSETFSPTIAEVHSDGDRLPVRANAELIVRAVNSNAAAVALAEAVEAWWDEVIGSEDYRPGTKEPEFVKLAHAFRLAEQGV